MPPAHERFDLDKPAGGKRMDRLVGQLQFSPFDGATQLVLDPQAFHRKGVHRRIEDLIASASTALDGIHRRVGVAQNVLGPLITLGIDGDSEASGNDHVLAFDLKWLG